MKYIDLELEQIRPALQSVGKLYHSRPLGLGLQRYVRDNFLYDQEIAHTFLHICISGTKCCHVNVADAGVDIG